jgi:hypothetical protein
MPPDRQHYDEHNYPGEKLESRLRQPSRAAGIHGAVCPDIAKSVDLDSA